MKALLCGLMLACLPWQAFAQACPSNEREAVALALRGESAPAAEATIRRLTLQVQASDITTGAVAFGVVAAETRRDWQGWQGSLELPKHQFLCIAGERDAALRLAQLQSDYRRHRRTALWMVAGAAGLLAYGSYAALSDVGDGGSGSSGLVIMTAAIPVAFLSWIPAFSASAAMGRYHRSVPPDYAASAADRFNRVLQASRLGASP